jgi:S1-C subfamily serine protease
VWLEVLSGEDAGRVVEVDRPLVLGRVTGADLVIRDARASRRHAELAPKDGALWLRDLGSANGTFVDGEPARDASFGYPTAAELARRGLPPGLWIRGVVPGSAADRAGLAANDYIVAADGRAQDGTLAGGCRTTGGVRSGDTVELTLRRLRVSDPTRTVVVRPD